MSIPVAVPDLAEAMKQRPYAYLLTVSDDGRPHAVAVVPSVASGLLSMEVGRRTASNAQARPESVSLVWPPSVPGEYSLIADGRAVVEGTRVVVTPTKAVLHRPAPASSEPATGESCGSDCQPVDFG
jgi:hypothetical protein